MLKLVISGGQTGVDQAALIAAKRHGIATGGWMPLGYRTEAGEYPQFRELYGMQEFPSANYPPRTRKNVASADATIWLGMPESAGYRQTQSACNLEDKPFVVSFTAPYRDQWMTPTRSWRDMADLIAEAGWETINVAGNRESKWPGLQVWATLYLSRCFARILDGVVQAVGNPQTGE